MVLSSDFKEKRPDGTNQEFWDEMRVRKKSKARPSCDDKDMLVMMLWGFKNRMEIYTSIIQTHCIYIIYVSF
jgi:hypothetical protein